MADRDKDIRKLQRAAAQRLTAANLLLENGFHLESIYIAGYAVECALKALILKRTPRNDHASMWEQLTRVGSKGHDFEYLKGLLKRPPANCALPRDISEMLRRVASWSTDLRYEVGLVSHADAEEFCMAAKHIRDWVERS